VKICQYCNSQILTVKYKNQLIQEPRCIICHQHILYYGGKQSLAHKIAEQTIEQQKETEKIVSKLLERTGLKK